MVPPPKSRGTLRKGSKGPEVTLLQGWMNQMPTVLNEILADGIFGPKTEARVQEFQKMMAVLPDGVVGPVTWNKINDALLAIGIPGVLPGSTGPQFNFKFTDDERPGNLGKIGWNEDKAWDLFSIRQSIARHNRSALGINAILAIFFEETRFCNMEQNLTSGGIGRGRGFGQLETQNITKQPYYKWADLPTDPPGTKENVRGERVSEMMLSSKDECVRIHVGWFNWMTEVGRMDASGILNAQSAGHSQYASLFREGGTKIGAAFATRKRIDMINALNWAPEKSDKHNSTPWPRYSKFWRFVIPDWSLVLGF